MTEEHVPGKWCTDLRCAKCYSADTWQKPELVRVTAERDEARENARKWCEDFTALEPELRRMVEFTKQCSAERDALRAALDAVERQIAETREHIARPEPL